MLAGRGMGEKLMQAALHWAEQQQVSTLRVATQMGTPLRLNVILRVQPASTLTPNGYTGDSIDDSI